MNAPEVPATELPPLRVKGRTLLPIVLEKWQRKNRLPDAIVIEHPQHAGGHLGAAKIEDLANPRFEFARVLEETFALFASLGLERERIPLVVAGGIASPQAVRAARVPARVGLPGDLRPA
jgi:nitronate monooxygenase